MKKLIPGLVFFICCSTAGLAQSVSGKVFDLLTGNGIPDVEIKASVTWTDHDVDKYGEDGRRGPLFHQLSFCVRRIILYEPHRPVRDYQVGIRPCESKRAKRPKRLGRNPCKLPAVDRRFGGELPSGN